MPERRLKKTTEELGQYEVPQEGHSRGYLYFVKHSSTNLNTQVTVT